MPPLNRLHLGCGGRILEGFLNVDASLPTADWQCDAMEALRNLHDNSADIIYSNAFLEHVERPVQTFLQECLRVLSDDGVALHLGIPNFTEVVKCYTEQRAGIVDWDGGVFGIENVSRYTHGTYDANDQHHEWLHKDIYDAEKLQRVGAVTPAVNIIKYCYPNEKYPLCLGLVVGKYPRYDREIKQLLSEPFVYGVDLNTLEFV